MITIVYHCHLCGRTFEEEIEATTGKINHCFHCGNDDGIEVLNMDMGEDDD